MLNLKIILDLDVHSLAEFKQLFIFNHWFEIWNMNKNNALHWLDSVVLFALPLETIIIGVHYAVTGNRQKTVTEYFTGNRKLSLISTVISYVFSFRSAGSIIGLPVESYYFGGQCLLTVFSFVWATVVH